MAVLVLQLVQTRILSVMFWNHFVYAIITLVLLGFGISGTWLAMGDRFFVNRWLDIRKASWGFILSALFSSLLLPIANLPQPNRLALVYFFTTLPYFFAGWVVGSIFQQDAKNIHRLYLWDLVGAGLGCLVYLVGMNSMGPIGLIVLSCFLGSLPLLWPLKDRRHAVSAALAIVFCTMAALVAKPIECKIEPEKTKAFMFEYANLLPGDEKKVELSEWNPISRVDVVSTKHGQKRIFTDGDAWTAMVGNIPRIAPPFQPELEPMLQQVSPYLILRKPESALVIGSGGGVDVWNALRGGATHVDAVDLNPTTARIVAQEYRSFNNDLFARPEVHLYTEEGRSFIARSRRSYDLIVSHATDTLTASQSGAYVLSENYLYTVEAMETYLRHLNPGGILCISRFATPASLRLFTTMLEALKRMKVTDPQAHIIAVERDWLVLMVRLTPFTQDEVNIVYHHTEKQGRAMNAHFIFPPIGEATSPQRNFFKAYSQAWQRNVHEAFLDSLPYDMSPTYDDRPFFFQLFKWDFWNFKSAPGAFFSRAPLVLSILLGCATIAVLLSIFLPLFLLDGGALGDRLFRGWAFYFFLIGYAYIFIEMALMQRFTLFLGHPSRSIALVLGSLLISTGIGSAFSKRLEPRFVPMLLTLVCLVVGSAVFYPALLQTLLGLSLWARAVVTILMVFPMGFIMGLPFPTGIRIASTISPTMTPWLWGINAGTTVLGSIAAIVLAMNLNFTSVLLIAAVGYLGVALIFVKRKTEMERV